MKRDWIWWRFHRQPTLPFARSRTTANFFINNLFTYRDRRLRGLAVLRGLFTFYAICSLGAVANVGIAGYVFSRNEVWWLAGLAGIVVGSVWNYAISSVFTWKQK